MSVIQRIRDKATWIIFGAIALALTAFILQDAFMGKGSMFGSSTTIGSVNGSAIDREDFEHKVSFYEQANAGQTTRDQLIGSVWEYMVNQKVAEQQYEKLGLTVNGKELSDILFGNNPPQWMQQAFTDPATGQFNANAARQQFNEIKKKQDDPEVINLYEGYIQPTIDQALRQKYQALLANAVYIPKWMAEKMAADNNLISKISYVKVPYTTISDSSIKVTDSEINNYVKKHSKIFERDEETRAINFVAFDASASATDSAAIREQLMQLKDEFTNTTDNKSFINVKGSEIPFYNSYRTSEQFRDQMSDSLFKLSPGQVAGPYTDGGNMVLAKMVGIRQIPDSATVRHILVSTHQQSSTGGALVRIRPDTTASNRLDSAIAAINSGASFDSITAQYSDDPGSNKTGGVYDYFPSGQMDESFNDFAFTGKPGDKKVVKTVYGYHYVEILGQRGAKTGYNIAYLAKPIFASQETVNAANTAAIQFASTSRNKGQFEANAAKLKKPATPTQEFKKNDFTINGVGTSRELVKWAYDNKVGDVSEPFEVDGKYIVAMISSINKEGLPDAATVRESVEPLVRDEKKAKTIIDTKMKGTTLEEISRNAGSPVEVADSIAFSGFVIPNVGNEPLIIGASFNKQIQGKVTQPIAGYTGVFVVRGEGISAVPSLGANAEAQREGLMNTLKQQVGFRFMESLKKGSDIEDNRSTFY